MSLRLLMIIFCNQVLVASEISKEESSIVLQSVLAFRRTDRFKDLEHNEEFKALCEHVFSHRQRGSDTMTVVSSQDYENCRIWLRDHGSRLLTDRSYQFLASHFQKNNV